jgi:prophage regulatory protein
MRVTDAMIQLPEIGFLRLPQIIGDPKAKPPIPAVIPVKKSCWWDGVRTGRFPKPVKLSPRVTVWRVEDIRDLIAKFSGKMAG